MMQATELESLLAPLVPAHALREELLCSVLAVALGRDNVVADADFFELGGDSMRATLALAQIRERLDHSLATAAFFDLRSAKRIAESLAPDSVGFDAEDSPHGFTPSWLELAHLAEVPAPRAAAATIGGHRLGADERRGAESRARALGVAPSVGYLHAFLRLLLVELGPGAFPVLIRNHRPGSSPSWLANLTDEAPLELPEIEALPLLQRGLLSAGNVAREGLAPWRSVFAFAQTTGKPELTLEAPAAGGLALILTHGDSLELGWASGAQLPSCDWNALYMRQLTALNGAGA